MKTRLNKLPKFTLVICLATSANIGSQSAFAQHSGARFSFAPNVWRTEEFHKPPMNAIDSTPHSVQNGSVPRSTNFLGVDPQMLSKPKPEPVAVAPVTQTHVVVRPTYTQAVPLNNPFKESFGKPVGLSAPIAALPPVAAPKSLPNSSAEKAVSAKLKHANNNIAASKNVNGRLLHAKHAVGRSAEQLALKNIDSYGKNFGYVPGPYLPTKVGSGLSTRTAVQGTILRR